MSRLRQFSKCFVTLERGRGRAAGEAEHHTKGKNRGRSLFAGSFQIWALLGPFGMVVGFGWTMFLQCLSSKRASRCHVKTGFRVSKNHFNDSGAAEHPFQHIMFLFSSDAIWKARWLLFDSLGDHFRTLGASWGTILAPWGSTLADHESSRGDTWWSGSRSVTILLPFWGPFSGRGQKACFSGLLPLRSFF